MRYRRGTISLSESRDYPLLRRVLHCGFVTSAQLYEFLKLDYCTSSRNAFDNRLRQLLAHELLVRHEIRSMNRGVVYSISRAGISEMIGKGGTTPDLWTAADFPAATYNTLWNSMTFT